MATVEQRLAKLEGRIGERAGRVIFVTGGEATDAERTAFLATKGIRLTARDMLFVTTYQSKPGSLEPPMPLRIASITTADGQLIAL